MRHEENQLSKKVSINKTQYFKELMVSLLYSQELFNDLFSNPPNRTIKEEYLFFTITNNSVIRGSLTTI